MRLSRIAKAWRALNRALLRLRPGQGRIARKHAREEVFRAVRRLKEAVDADHPPIRKPVPEAVKRRAAHRRALSDHAADALCRREGYLLYSEVTPDARAAMEVAGFKPRRRFGSFWLPKWAAYLAENGIQPAALSGAIRSVKRRQVLLAQVALAIRTGNAHGGAQP